VARVSYEFEDLDRPGLWSRVEALLASLKPPAG
jgi:hypothetical protein